MKKILYVITKSNFGGAQRYVYDLAANIPRSEFEPVVAFGPSGASAESGTLAKLLADAGIRTIFIPELARDIGAGDMAALLALVRTFRSERPDIVHLNSSKAGGLGAVAARIAGIPRIIFTAHGWPFWEERNPLARSLIFFFSYLTVALSHFTICISEYDRRAAAMMPFVKRKLRVINNGMPYISFLSGSDARAKLFPPEEIEMHKDDIWLASNGELHPNKNYFIGIDAVARYNSTATKKIFYAIMGSGELQAPLEAYTRDKGLEHDVRLLGFVPDGRAYLPAFDIFFLPSKKEGMPYALLEAALAALPVIASDVGGIPELVTNGELGLLCEPADVEGFAEALSTYVQDEPLRAKFAAALSAKAALKYSLKSMVESTVRLY